ncbi:endonuclease/exonuclease/phosphatase family protein [Micromonospora sp.]|uniref:endonuclease/exonuclease/phosphatase family protein n=1 Tax=unclassified Micromonospora TaxID=2617518 RepID=UPI003B3A497B
MDDLSGGAGRTGLLDAESSLATLTDRIRVATWNVREGLPAASDDVTRRPEALAQMVDLVDEFDIDVLALQEVDFTAEGESEVLSALLTRTALQYAATMPLSESSFEKGKRAGVAVASRYPVSRIGGVVLPNPRLSTTRGRTVMALHDKGMVSCTLDFGFTEVTVASLHSFPFHRFGRDAGEPAFSGIWKSVSAALPRSDSGQVVICGDFNTEDRDLVLGSMENPMVRAFGEMATHNGMAIDDILFSADLSPAVEPKLVSNFSDHELCMVDLVSRW